LIKGTIGESLNTQDGYDAGRQCAIALISTLKAHTGDLDKVHFSNIHNLHMDIYFLKLICIQPPLGALQISRIVKVFGVVNCIPGFPDAPKAVNGASDLLMEVFGEKGVHARTGMISRCFS
jgi:hypothetical protein